MPPLERSDLCHDAVLWELVAIDNYGKRTVRPPIQIKVRWLGNRKQVLDPQGNTVEAIGLVIADRAIAPLSLLWHGTLCNWYGTGSDRTVESDIELVEVVTYNDTADIKGRFIRNECYIARYKNALPPLG